MYVTVTWKIPYVSYPRIYATVQSFPDNPLVAVTCVDLVFQINWLQIFCVYEMFDHYIAPHFCKFWEKLFLIIFQDQSHHFIIVSIFHREKITLRECCDRFHTISPNATVDKIFFKKLGTYNRLLAKSPFPSPFPSLRRINLKITKDELFSKNLIAWAWL